MLCVYRGAADDDITNACSRSIDSLHWNELVP